MKSAEAPKIRISAATRSESSSMPGYPTLSVKAESDFAEGAVIRQTPAGNIDLGASWIAKPYAAAAEYYIPAGAEITGNINLNGKFSPHSAPVLYVAGKLTLDTSVTVGQATLAVLPGGEVYIKEAKANLQQNAVNPAIYVFEGGTFTTDKTSFSCKTVVKMVTQLLETLPMQSEYLPEELKERYRLADINYALKTIHFPKNKEELLVSRKRLVFDEFLLFIISVRRMKEKAEETPNCFPVKETWLTEEVIERLPYSLTNAQLNAWHEIERDLAGRTMMSRLVQGDVGSGKTILAFLAMFLVADNGYQAALMAPTEVLARQHYEGFLKLMEEQGLSFPTVLLTGSDTAKEKRIAYERIASGEAAIIIGTHALIQEKVEYANLALVITDEQHRFGVKQREALTTRGNPPNVLVMSATPIPRTLAIILYGDLDISVIDELPAKRLPIKNCVVNTSYRPKAYKSEAKRS